MMGVKQRMSIRLFIIFFIIGLAALTVRGQGMMMCRASFNCDGRPGDVLGFVLGERSCCLDFPRALAFVDGEGNCVPCIVVGFLNTSFIGVEQGPGHSIPVGYQKGGAIAGQDLVFNVQNTPGTASEGRQLDYTVNTVQVRALFSATQPDNVVVTFHMDAIAQELNETFTLTLIPLVQPTPRRGLFFYDSIQVTIIDSNLTQFICYSSNECHGNVVSGIGVVEDCCIVGGGLSYRSTSGQCADCYDQRSFTSEGSQFIFGIFDNHHPDGPFEINRLRIAVDPLDRNRSSFTVESLGKTTQYTGPQEISFKANEVQLNDPKSRDRAIQIRSLNDGPLSVVAYSEEFVSSDSFKVLPCVRHPNVGYEYYAVSVIQSQIEFQLFNSPGVVLPPEGKSAIVIVTTEDNTTLDITLTQDVFVGDANDLMDQVGGDTIRAGETVTISFPKAMQTLYLASNDDLTGSRVVSNRPISFTSGHECGTLPNTMLYCDQMVDQIPPTSTWGKMFIVAALDSRSSNDSIKIVASRNDTIVRVRCSLSSLPYEVNISEAGDSIDTVLISDDSCYFESNNPVLLVQFSRSSLLDSNLNSDPFMVVIPPVEQYRSNYIIRTFATSDENSPAGLHYLNILLPGDYNPALVYLDGQPITEGATTQSIICNVELETICAYTLQLQITEATHTLSHADPSARLNAVVYWYSFRVGQGYFAGMMQLPIALPTVTVEALNNFANESSGEALFLLRRSGNTDVEATVVLETSNISPPPNPAGAGEDFQAVKMDVTFLSGVTEVMVSVPLIDDPFPEQDFETFEVVLSASPGVLIGSPSFVTFTIMDDDPPLPVVNVSVESVSLTTSELAGSVQVRLLKTNNAIGPVSVLVSTSDGTAQSDDLDYVSITEMVTFDPDELAKTVSVMINADLKIEDPKEFFVIVRPINNAQQPFPVQVNENQGITTVTIEDEDVAVIGFAQSFYEFSEGSEGSVQVSLLLGGRQLQRTITVMVFSVDGTATGGADYDAVSGVVEFSPNRTLTVSILINVLADSMVEPSQTFSLRLGLMESSSVILSPTEATVNIIDRDRAIISLEPLRPLVREGDGSARVNVTLRGASYPSADVSITTSSLTAAKDEDYSDPLVTVVRLSQENSFEEVLIPIVDDRLFEGPIDEQFTVRISLPSCNSPGGLIIENAEATVSIQDNDIRPVARVGFSSASYSGVEGSQINLVVEGDGANQQPLTVQYSVLRTGTAAISIDVVLPTFGTLTLPAGGRSSAAIPVSLVEDTIAEASEWFLVMISVGSEEGEIISGAGTANITILDNDRVIFGFETTEFSVAEGQGVLQVNVLKLTEASQNAIVRFSTRDVLVGDSASHSARDEILTFQPGERSRTIPITLVNDDIVGESVEIFNIRLTALPGQLITTAVQDGLAQVIVSDDDRRVAMATLAFSQSEYRVSEGGGSVSPVSVCLNLISITEGVSAIEGVTVMIVIIDMKENNTIADFNSTITLESSALGRPVYCALPSFPDDNIVQGNRQFVAIASIIVQERDSVTFAPEGDLATITVIDEDNFFVGWEFQAYTTSEGSDSVEICMIVMIAETIIQTPAVFSYRFISSGEAIGGGVDYSEPDGTTLTFQPGDTRTCISIPIVDDQIAESTECFFVNAQPRPDSRSLISITNTTTVCIADNDPRSAVLQFSQSDYAALEGGEGASVCLVLVSLTGQLIENATVGVIVPGPQGRPSTLSRLVDLTPSLIGETVFCGSPSYPEDDLVLGDLQFTLTAFAMVDEPDTVSFSPGGDQANLTYVDNDEFTVGWEPTFFSVIEGSRQVELCLSSFSGNLTTSARFNINTASGEAQGGIDYQELNTILTFESMTTVCTQISIIDDDIPEERECFSVLAAPQPDGTGRNIRVVISNATVCIDDNDLHSGQIGFSQSNYTAMEGGEAVLVCIALLSRTGPLTGSAFIGFSVSQGPLEEFRASGEVNFAGAMVSDPLLCQNLTIQEDNIAEPDQVSMLSAFIEGPEFISYAPGGDETTIIVIDNDASATIGFSQANYTAVEGGDPISICLVVVSLTGQPTDTILVGFSGIRGTPFNFDGAQVGDEVLCTPVNISDDNVVVRRDGGLLVSAFIEALPSSMITFSPGRDTATLFIDDNDLELVIGWESVSYTAFEGDQGSETICLVVENDKVLGESAILAINGSNFGEGSALAGIDYTVSPVLIFDAGSSRACANVTIFADQVTEQVECFDLVASTDNVVVTIRGSRTTVCIVDIPPPIRAECLLNQTRGSSSASVSCTTSNVPPDTLIEFMTCEIDGVRSDICTYPSFTINTDNFEPGQHRLVLVLRVGASLLRLMPDLMFEGTASPTTVPPTPPPRPTDPFREPFLVSCNIDVGQNSLTATVNCAATVGSSRVNIDSCVLDSNPSEICNFPSFSFSTSGLEPGSHTLTITFSDANNPESIDVEMLMFTGPEPN